MTNPYKNQPIVDKDVEVTISKSQSYDGYGVFRFSDKALESSIGVRKKYHVTLTEI